MQVLKYNIQGSSYTVNTEIPVEQNCNAFTVINEGDGIAFVNGIELKPYPPGHPELTGEAVTVGGNIGEVYSGRIEIKFEIGQAAPKVVVIKKYYL